MDGTYFQSVIPCLEFTIEFQSNQLIYQKEYTKRQQIIYLLIQHLHDREGWDEIDFNNKLWNIPAERMKSKKHHSVPLTKQTLMLLELMQTISSESEYVFPSDRRSTKHINSQTANTALKRMGFKNQLVAHGLRSLASTILNEEGFDGDTIEAALAHTGDNEVRNAYNRADYIKRRIPLMKWWSEHIDKAATGNMSLTGKKELRLVNS